MGPGRWVFWAVAAEGRIWSLLYLKTGRAEQNDTETPFLQHRSEEKMKGMEGGQVKIMFVLFLCSTSCSPPFQVSLIQGELKRSPGGIHFHGLLWARFISNWGSCGNCQRSEIWRHRCVKKRFGILRFTDHHKSWRIRLVKSTRFLKEFATHCQKSAQQDLSSCPVPKSRSSQPRNRLMERY